MSVTGRIAKATTDYDDPASLGSRLRARRIVPLIDMIDRVHRERGAVRIIDIGGTESYWTMLPSDYLDKQDVTITVLNLPSESMPEAHGRFIFAAGNGCELNGYADDAFDIAHSNSVIEHVGDRQHAAAFAREFRRVAPNYFIQTPNFWFPVEPHFMTPCFQWLPASVRVWLVRHFQLGNHQKTRTAEEARTIVDSVHLLDKRAMRELFGADNITVERFLGMPKSLIAMRFEQPSEENSK